MLRQGIKMDTRRIEIHTPGRGEQLHAQIITRLLRGEGGNFRVWKELQKDGKARAPGLSRREVLMTSQPERP